MYNYARLNSTLYSVCITSAIYEYNLVCIFVGIHYPEQGYVEPFCTPSKATKGQFCVSIKYHVTL